MSHVQSQARGLSVLAYSNGDLISVCLLLAGREIERALLSTARAHPNITFFEHHLATDLVSDEIGGVQHCLGVDALDQHTHSMIRFVAPVTMLATGGAGQVDALQATISKTVFSACCKQVTECIPRGWASNAALFAGLSNYDKPRRHHRRWNGDGCPGFCSHERNGIRSVSPNRLFLGEGVCVWPHLPHLGGGQRRRGPALQQGWGKV